MNALLMQAFIAIILLGLMWFQRSDTRSVLLYAVTLVIPIGWGYSFWSAWKRDEAARHEGRPSKEFLQAERKRTMGLLGGLMLVWVVLAILVMLAF